MQWLYCWCWSNICPQLLKQFVHEFQGVFQANEKWGSDVLLVTLKFLKKSWAFNHSPETFSMFYKAFYNDMNTFQPWVICDGED